MVTLIAATLFLSVSTASGNGCVTYEPSADELTGIRLLLGDAVPEDAELSHACTHPTEPFAPLGSAARLTYVFTFTWLSQGSSGTRFVETSQCTVLPTKRATCIRLIRLARLGDEVAIWIEDSLTESDLQSVLSFWRRTLGDPRPVFYVRSVSRKHRERGSDSETEFEIYFDRSRGEGDDDWAYFLTRVCSTPIETLEKCTWKLDGPHQIMK